MKKGGNEKAGARNYRSGNIRHFPPQCRNTLIFSNEETGALNGINGLAEWAGQAMPLMFTNLGFVLCHIYEFDFGAAVYLPTVERYEADTPCIVAVPTANTEAELAALHQSCIDQGFQNWLNIAVVSDTCDATPDQSEASLIAAFNEDCREGGWLWKMMNYRKSGS